MIKDRIAVFDSGLGGLTAVRELFSVLPRENIVYFGDTARVPYGTRSVDLIRRFARQDLEFLLQYEPKAVLVACGTMSAVALEDLRTMTDVPVIGVVSPAAQAAAKATRNGKIGILGTAATIQSGAYEAEIRSLRPVEVISRSCPLFVPLVENGYVGRESIAYSVALDYTALLREAGVDTVILGCTHYPLLRPLLGEIFGENVVLVDSGREGALELANVLYRQNLQTQKPFATEHLYFVTDEVDHFTQLAGMFLNSNLEGKVRKVEIG